MRRAPKTNNIFGGKYFKGKIQPLFQLITCSVASSSEQEIKRYRNEKILESNLEDKINYNFHITTF